MKIIDMHCDTISRISEERATGNEWKLWENSGHLDGKRITEGGYLLQNFALFVNLKKCTDPWEELCKLHRIYEQEIWEEREKIGKVLCYRDILENEQMGKVSALLTVEEGAVCKGELGRLRILHEKGVRMMTLTWNYENELGCPAGSAGGLSDKGKEFVEEMERLGMIPDVSHLSDAGFEDVAALAKKPFVASHSNARSVCDSKRNLTDAMIRKLAEKGGCMGLNFYAPFLKSVPEGEINSGKIQDVIHHAKHIVNCGGIEVLGLGSDFDGFDTNEELPGAQSMELLWGALRGAGFSEGQLDKIFYQNVMRVYRDVL